MKTNKKEKCEPTREKIVKYSQKGWSQVKIEKHLKCSRCWVQNTLKRFVETGVHKNRKKTGRNRITTERDDRKIERISLKNRKKSSSAVASVFSKDEIHKISSRTVRRRLNEAGLKGRRARKKPWLSGRLHQKSIGASKKSQKLDNQRLG